MALKGALVTGMLVLSLGACSTEESSIDSLEGNDETLRSGASNIERSSGTAGNVSPSVSASPLAGTSWRLVKILEMNDTVHRPDEPGRYTLRFGIGDDISLQIDCNSGKGTWHSENPGQLTFGPIAATRAMCPPGSLHDKFLAQFEWVRSYMIEDGHLYLATMADGAIIEFEPAADP